QEGIERLSEVLVDKPQIPAFDTHHFNLPGMYMRKVTITKHSIVVGKIHKMAHFAIIAKGKCAVSGNDGVRGMYEAGDVITSQAGIQRVVVALEDCVFITFHKTNHTDLTDIYNELMESPKFDLYDANNQLKDPMLAQEKKQVINT
ncbi:MAG: hypothetical protein ACREQ5_09585, partial [Candidatus Dormibacteria bacterium]